MVRAAEIFMLLAAVYELSTVLSDAILNFEYVQRNWVEEYILSLVVLVLNGVVMGVIGMRLEAKHSKNRYCANNTINEAIAFILGLFQLRVLVETYFSICERQCQERNEPHSNEQGLRIPDRGEVRNADIQESGRFSQDLQFVTFAQAVVRDIPLFLIQANATIHYRMLAFLDLWAVCSSGLSLLHGIAKYLTRFDPKLGIRLAGSMWLFGQFVFRFAAILTIALTLGSYMIYYFTLTSIISILTNWVLGMTHSTSSKVKSLEYAVLYFPFYYIFCVNGANVHGKEGSTMDVLHSRRVHAVSGWRFLENAAAIAIAVIVKCDEEFGNVDKTVVLSVGIICATIYVVTWMWFAAVAVAYTIQKAHWEVHQMHSNMVRESRTKEVPVEGYLV